MSVSLSKDGNTLAIGAKAHDNAKGHTRVFKWNGSAWASMGAEIDGQAAGDESGYSVSLNADGTKLAIGAPEANAAKLEERSVSYRFPLPSSTKVTVADVLSSSNSIDLGFILSPYKSLGIDIIEAD